MSKRIYFGLENPDTAKEISRRTGIDLSRLQQAAAGKIELTEGEKEKVERALERFRSGSIKKPFGN